MAVTKPLKASHQNKELEDQINCPNNECEPVLFPKQLDLTLTVKLLGRHRDRREDDMVFIHPETRDAGDSLKMALPVAINNGFFSGIPKEYGKLYGTGRVPGSSVGGSCEQTDPLFIMTGPGRPASR